MIIIPDSPQDLGLPWASWRPGQKLALRTALHSKRRHTVINAPTGVGKSAIASGLMALDERRQIVVTGTKALEDQYRADVPFVVDIRGMGNYECRAAKDQFVDLFRRRRGVIYCDDGPCRMDMRCDLKDNGCDYFDQRRSALAAQSALTNYSYLVAMNRFGGGLGAHERLICDEAHAIPEELMKACSVSIPLSVIEGNPPSDIDGWREWATRRLEELAPKTNDAEDKRVRKQRLIDSLEQLTRMTEEWAFDLHDQVITFEPTIPRRLFRQLAPDTVRQIVYLSATVTPGTLRLLGIPDDEVSFQYLKSRFDVKRRPVYCLDTCRVDYRMTQDQIAWWLHQIDKIIEQRLDRKGIIHTVSYLRAQDILAGSKFRKIMLAPTRAGELASALQRFRSERAPMILLSPAVTTGLNFPGRDAEYQIIAKMPFPDTRSRIAKARIDATPGYRDHLWTQALIQAAGRLMRSEDDQGETFVTDDHCRWALPRAQRDGLLPEWFWDAVERVKTIPPPPPRLPT